MFQNKIVLFKIRQLISPWGNVCVTIALQVGATVKVKITQAIIKQAWCATMYCSANVEKNEIILHSSGGVQGEEKY